MGAALLFLLVIILVGVAVILFVIGAYNALVTLRNRYKNAYAQIDVQLKRRYDLIPNLVETAKGYLQHERVARSRGRGTKRSRNRKCPCRSESGRCFCNERNFLR